MKIIVKSYFIKTLLCFLTIFNPFYSGAEGEILKENKINETDFENILSQYSVKFYEYEKPANLFDDFFGLPDPLNKSTVNTNFQDLSLQIDSKNVRELYTEKLLEMTKKNKKNEQDNPKWSFFNQKI